MPITGQDFDRIIDLKSDNAYSGYFDNFKKNRLIREATIKAIDIKIATNDRVQTESDLFGIYKTNQVFTPASNTVNLVIGGAGIPDYFRLMNIKAKYVVPLAPIYITDALNTTPLRFTLSADSNLRTKEQVVISGVTVNTNANGTRYVKMMGKRKGQLYADANLLTPIAGNGQYSGTSGSISRVVYNPATDMHPNRKFSKLNEPNYYNPKFELADSVVKIYPLSWVCSETTADFISVPTFIDVNDNITDLLTIYPERFIYFLADEVCKLMALSDRDNELAANSQSELLSP